MTFWGFDGVAHTGTMVGNAKVATEVVTVFRTFYAARFPIRRMQPVEACQGSDPTSMADDNTSGFKCRYAVAPGPKLVGARLRLGDRHEHGGEPLP